jgi:O-antigen/teichoic acid export membrane protein
MKVIERIKTAFHKKSIRQACFIYAGSLINGGSLFIINAALGRSLSKDWYATFTLAILVLTTVAETSDLGLNGALSRFAPFFIAQKHDGKLRQLVRIIWRWRVGLSAAITGGGLILSYPLAYFVFKQPSLAPYLAFSFLGVGGVILLGFVNTFLQANQRFLYNATLQMLKGVIRLVLIGMLILFHVESLFYYLAVYLAVPWILFAASFHVLPKGFRHTSIDDKETRSVIHSQVARFSSWLTIWSLFSIIATRVDQAMISRYLGLEQVAIYTAAYQLIQLYPLVSQTITTVLAPKTNGFTSKKLFIPFIGYSLRWILLPVVVLGVLVYPSQYLITLFFGHAYDASLGVYLVLAYSLVFNLLVIPFSLIIVAYNRTDLMAASGIIQFVVNIVGTVLLIPRFGVMGAAYTYAFGILVAVLYNIACAMYLLKRKEIIVV